MSYYTCESCNGCGGRCDQCTATVCLNNMNEHRKIFELGNLFIRKVNNISSELSKELNNISDYLKNNTWMYWLYRG